MSHKHNDNNAAWIGDSTITARFPAWTRGNAADVFPDPFSRLGQTLVLTSMAQGLRDGYISFGALSWDEFDNPEAPDLFMVFGGYVYNPLSMTRVLGARMPGASPEMIDKAFFDEGADIPVYEPEPWHESPKHEALLGASMGWAMSTDSLPELDADRALAHAARDSRPDLSTVTDAALIARARSMGPILQQCFENAMRVSSLASLGPGALGAICAELGDPSLSIRLLAGIEVDSAAPSHAMWNLGRLARANEDVNGAFEAGADGLLDRLRAGATTSPNAAGFVAQFDDFIRQFGSRAQNEYDVISTSWEIDPRIALVAIDLMRRSDESQAPAVRHDAAVAERDAVATRLRAQLAGAPETLGMFEAALQSASVFLSGRERAKTNTVMVINEMRVALREYGRRLAERGSLAQLDHLFMATNAELDHIRQEPDRFTVVLAERWTNFRALFDLEPPFSVNHVAPTLADMTRRDAKRVSAAPSGTVLHGTGGSGGVVTGRARVVMNAAHPEGLEPGDVLIAPQTDPSWVPLFVPAVGVVVNVGAMGSHAMIVSRELGIPCVVAVADATSLIADGVTVTVDGNAGTVTIH
jgi:rifampicin phosphotransferase